MLFNSYPFIFVFLPIVLTGYYLIGGQGHHRIAAVWLVAASLFFYAWWNPAYLGLIMGSMLFNYAVGVSLLGHHKALAKKIVIFGITADLALLAYYKYANFLVDSVNQLFNAHFTLATIVLPLGISFFTFLQIAYLVDTYTHTARQYNFLNYCLFVLFFPHLIAGPLVHHREILPQFAKNESYLFNQRNFTAGLTIFVIGLFKKVILADGTTEYASTTFNLAESGVPLTLVAAWGGAIAYSFQLYFDFSGYSDMAIGLSKLFNIRLPMNFNSPYKSTSIIEFWRRWHITLSRFLKDYLYIPLGGNRKGVIRQFLNLFITMTLGGLWHGAALKFILWGAIHGLLLVINNVWRKINAFFNSKLNLNTVVSTALTFAVVTAAWVPFRAATMKGTLIMWRGMLGLNGIMLPPSWEAKLGALSPWLLAHNVRFVRLFDQVGAVKVVDILWFLLLSYVIFFLPNTQQLMRRYRPVYEKPVYYQTSAKTLLWRPTAAWSFALTFLFVYAVLGLSRISEFLYFQF
jgi:D-alanyl-lipoteichoic acid acyltransferase DltB (MBOAT superfamily)